jgi:bifunctional DNA-binding transcriptional regulator/antitoxin component of YhaV-PrlF toxin-antitoxin module
MKLIKHYTTKDKRYYKYELVIPNKKIEEVGLKVGDELEVSIGDKKIIIQKKN